MPLQTQPVDMGRGADSVMGAVVHYQTVGFELLEMVADGVERAIQRDGQGGGGRRTGLLEPPQNGRAGATESDRVGRRGGGTGGRSLRPGWHRPKS